MSADERLAIWRYATPEERQLVIDGEWESARDSPTRDRATLMHGGHTCCPWGVALGGYDNPRGIFERPGWPAAETVARHIGDEEILTMVGEFMYAWDNGRITRDDMIAYLRQLNAQEAAQPGQATVWLAVGTWLAVLVAIALAVYGAAWITGAWLAPWGG